MSQTEILKQYAQQKIEQQVSLLANAPEMVRQIQQMRRELQALPQEIADLTSSSLEPMARMAEALDKGLDTQRALMQPLIQEAVDSIKTQMLELTHDRVQRSVKMARDQHLKAMQAGRAANGWMTEAKAARKHKAQMQVMHGQMQAQIQMLTLRFWVTTGVAATLAVVLALMILGRFL